MFIKKLILSTLIVLGTIASTQAQSNTTFDFSCTTAGPSQEELDFGFDRDQEPQFEADDIAMFSGTLFLQGGATDGPTREDRVVDINHYVAIHNIPGTCNDRGNCQTGRVTIDAEDDGRFYVGTYNLQGRGGDYDTFAEAFAAANVIINDLDNNGFAIVEEEMLSDAAFNEASTGIYNYSFDDGSSYIELQITTRDDAALPFVLRGGDLQDADGNYTPLSYHATLQDAMDYILMTYPSIFN